MKIRELILLPQSLEVTKNTQSFCFVNLSVLGASWQIFLKLNDIERLFSKSPDPILYKWYIKIYQIP